MEQREAQFFPNSDEAGRKQIEQQLRLMQFSIDHAADFIHWIDPHGRILYANEASCLRSGYSLDEVLSMTIFDLDASLTPESWREAWDSLRAAGSQCFEAVHHAKSGETYPLDVSANYVELDGQEFGCIIARDVGARKRAERELARSERRFGSLIEHAADAIYVLSYDGGRLIACNEQACKDTGYSREELQTMSASDIEVRLTPGEIDALHVSLGLCSPATAEGEHRRKDGSTFPVEIRLALMQEGEPQQILAIVRDVTERKRAEEALRQSEAQFRQSQKMEAVGQLAGGIAHDFNNLLTAILGYSDLLLVSEAQQGLPPRPALQEIKRAAERAAALTQQILAFSRRQPLRPVRVSLNETILGMEDLLRRTLGEDVELVTLLGSDLGLTEVDVNQFEQVVMNLAINARDAMPAGGRLTLKTANAVLSKRPGRTSPGLEPVSHVTLSVSDTGVGMDEETAAHIFEPFFTTKGVGEGTGLGLSTVYGILRQSGGSIEVQSRPGEGSTFRVYLPVAAALMHDLG